MAEVFNGRVVEVPAEAERRSGEACRTGATVFSGHELDER